MSEQVQHSTAPWRLETEHFQDGEAEPVEWEQPRILWTGWDEKEHRQRYTRARFNSAGYSREGAALAMADARLIVAAPALLKALRQIGERKCHCNQFNDDYECSHEVALGVLGLTRQELLAQARPSVGGKEQADG